MSLAAQSEGEKKPSESLESFASPLSGDWIVSSQPVRHGSYYCEEIVILVSCRLRTDANTRK
jgi:hypothetical protein